MQNSPIKVAIVEDIDVLRQGMVALLNGSPGFRCVGEFCTGEDACIILPELEHTDDRADVLLMDINLPKMNGLDCIRILRNSAVEARILMLTILQDEESIFAALEAGANGYMLKNTPAMKLLESVQDVHNGLGAMSGQIALKMMNAFRKLPPSHKEHHLDNNDYVLLTQREQETLQYLSVGKTYQQIADTMSVSLETVRTHIKNSYTKLHVNNKHDAVRRFRQQGRMG